MSATNQGLVDLQAAVAAQTTQSALIVTDFQSLNSQIAALKAQIAAGTEVTDAQLEQLAQTLTSAQANVAAALAPAS